MSNTDYCGFPWTTIFLPKITFIVIKGTILSSVFNLPVCLHKHTKNSLDPLWSLSPLCWNLHKKPLDWLFSPLFRTQKLSHTPAIWLHLYQLFPSSLWGFHCSCSFLFSHLFRKATFGPSLERLPWNTESRGLLLSSQVNPTSSGLSGDIQNPDMPPSTVTFQSKSCLTKPPLMTGLSGFMQRNLMLSLTASECQTLGGSCREK